MTFNHAIRGLLGAVLMLGGAGVALAADTDGRLEEKVETRLKDDTRFDKLDVDVQEGVVTLRGEVASSAQKVRAEKLARAAGARKVINDLEIDPDKAVAQIKDTAEAKKQRIDEQAERQKEAVDRRAEAAADRVEKTSVPAPAPAAKAPAVVVDPPKADPVVVEPSVTAKVKTGLESSEALTGSHLNVDTGPDGVVTLKGTVPSSTAEARAIEIARTTDGVRKVVDEIDVKESGTTLKVKSQFNKDETLARSEIDVHTDSDGVVTLRGTVPTAAAEARAIEIARSMAGVTKVVDEIEVGVPVVR